MCSVLLFVAGVLVGSLSGFAVGLVLGSAGRPVSSETADQSAARFRDWG